LQTLKRKDPSVSGSIILKSSFMRKGFQEVVQVRVQWWAAVNREMKLAMEPNRIIKCAVAPLSGYLHGLRLCLKQCDKIK
jgi:hypothetical protein